MSDALERQRALDPATSFLVRAPAGSGKTGLLIYRILRLLSTVDEPEEVLATTFTRKAAAEMRNRVLEQLRRAHAPAPEAAFERQGWELARAVLERDAERAWGLLESPGRLRIQTLDSFESMLVARLPWLARWGVRAGVTEQAAPIYEEAVRGALRELAGPSPATENPGALPLGLEALIRLLNLRDNRLESLTAMLVTLAEKRDEWLRPLGATLHSEEALPLLRELLEANLRVLIESRLLAAKAVLPRGLDDDLAPLLRFAASQLASQSSPVEALADFEHWPAATAADLPLWRGLAVALLTKDGQWRKRLTKNEGFPSDYKAEKQRFSDLLDCLRDNDTLREALAVAGSLPDPCYSELQWDTLAALFRMLRELLPQLQLQFARRGETDFTEVALRAASAMEEAPGLPTVLAERLDASIRHILVDEFQDTSVLQMDIIRKLTENWQPDDGRSLFLVGDPMQSIYGWRNARVDLFLRAWEGNLKDLPSLENLQLRRNFRSHPRLVDEWNGIFQDLFPGASNPTRGEVEYVPAVAGRGEALQSAAPIGWQVFLEESDHAEANWIAEQVVGLREQSSVADRKEPRIGVLFRAGRNAHLVAEALQARGLRYQSVGLENLASLPVISDLRSLLRALLLPADRLAWWSLLRAPWNGLTLAELQQLQQLSGGGLVWRAIRLACSAERDRFSADTLVRLDRTRLLFDEAFRWRGRRPLAALVRALFLNTGASQWHGSARAQLAAQEFFRLLADGDDGDLIADPSLLDGLLEKLHAPPDPEAPDSLQLLTIHKAKGLEFDVVFVPFTNAQPPSDSVQALTWEEVPAPQTGTAAGDDLLMLVPADPREAGSSPLLKLVREIRAQKQNQERLRVLYVALTRAREQLYVTATINPDQIDAHDDDATVASRAPLSYKAKQKSYLGLLHAAFQPALEAAWDARQTGTANAGMHEALAQGADPAPPEDYPLLQRITLQTLVEPRGVARAAFAGQRDTDLPAGNFPVGEEQFYRPGGSWETMETATGTVFHRIMELACEKGGLDRLSSAAAALEPLVMDELRTLLPAEPRLDEGCALVMQALTSIAISPQGRRLFAASHRQVFVEQAISYVEGNTLREARLDRVFQDAEGHWHIVDFKLVAAAQQNAELFRRQQRQRYGATMERYGRLWQQHHPAAVSLTLYFPLQDLAEVWTLPVSAAPAGAS